MVEVALYPGTFDPVTYGHISVIRQAVAVFKQVVVGVSTSRPATLLPAAARLQLVQESCRGVRGVRCESYDGLTAVYAQKIGVEVIVRGLRSLLDFAPEQAMVSLNKHYAPDIACIFLMGDSQSGHISSTLVREVYAAGGDLDGLVPPCVKSYFDKAMP